MIKPDFKTFKEYSRKYKRVTLYREIAGDLLTPISLLNNFSGEKNLFLLESANLDRSFSRYTFFGFSPVRIITFRGGVLYSETAGRGVEKIDVNPFDYLTSELAEESAPEDTGMGSFAGGFVGFIGYDMVNYMDTLREPVKIDDENLLMGFFETEEFYVFDNAMGKLYAAKNVISSGNPDEDYRTASDRTLAMGSEILGVHKKMSFTEDSLTVSSEMDESAFMEKVSSLVEEVGSGEAIQVVLSNRYMIESAIDPVNLYRVLRNINPSPYMFYMKFGDEIICGTSPEVHLKITGNRALLKPIAGTYRHDGGNVEEIKAALLADEKERAEHLMLVDLARNDLNTGCVPESVHVVYSFSAEVYSHVIHIVSEVEGELRDDVPPLRLFCSTFPAGTVSGAPKVRAMELIDKYETSPRGFYAGCAGYLSYNGDIDTCILIRSAMVKKNSVTLRAGAGIVYDSVPEKEFAEVGNKLGALFQAIKKIPLLEKRNVFNDR